MDGDHFNLPNGCSYDLGNVFCGYEDPLESSVIVWKPGRQLLTVVGSGKQNR